MPFNVTGIFYTCFTLFKGYVAMRLSERLIEKSIIINSSNREKNALIEELVDALIKAYALEHRDSILDAVLDRESKLSTGIGCGLAVPHAKIEQIDKMYMVAMTVKEGVDFEAIDKEPVYLFFLVISPSSTVGPHIKALSSISRIMADSEVRKQLVNAETTESFLEILKTAEEKYL
jgi:mannitol/fructose-specific phosphotransferase system IIA component (Ntr-type)